MTVAAHMLYENADPFRLREPGGTLDTSAAVYTAVDDRVTRVEGSIFEQAEQTTIKLEGAAIGGYETVSLVGIRDPHVARGTWMPGSQRFSANSPAASALHLGLDRAEYDFELRAYGHNAVLGALEPGGEPPREVGVLFKARAADQSTATAIAKIANPLMLHLPLEGDDAPAELRLRDLPRRDRARGDLRVRPAAHHRRRRRERAVPHRVPGGGRRG